MPTGAVNDVAATPKPNTPAAKPTPPKPGPSKDYETFLKMLTTQIKNQDPLNPMEGSDFAVQLATFSGVEQQVRTNDLLSKMVDAGEAGLNGAVNWIGKAVRTTQPVPFSGAPLRLTISPKPGADQVQLVAVDPQGREVLRQEIGPGSGDVEWIGRGPDGKLIPPGFYRFRIESMAAGKSLGTTDVGAYGMVDGAEVTPDGIRLSLHGGGAVLASQVNGVRGAGG